MVFDTSHFVMMQKLATVTLTPVTTDTTIHYSIDINGGNASGVPVVIECFTDSACTFGFVVHTYTVSGSHTATFSGFVSGVIHPCTHYWLRTTVTNPVTGTVVLVQPVTTTCAFTTLPYLELWDSTTHTDRSAIFNVGINCFGRNATAKVMWKKVSETYWHMLPITLDTNTLGLQTVTLTTDSLMASTNYMYYVTAVNIVGPSNLGTKYFRTDDTVLSSTGHLSITAVSGIYNGADSIIFSDYLTNVPGGTATLNSEMKNNGSIVSTIDPITSSISYGSIRIAFPTFGDTGTFTISSWVYDDQGSTDSVGNYVLYSKMMTVHVSGINNTAVVEIVDHKTIHGKVSFFDAQLGIKISEYECVFGEISQKSPKEIYCIYNFVSDDGKFAERNKIFVH